MITSVVPLNFSYKKQELLALRQHLCPSPVILVVSMLIFYDNSMLCIYLFHFNVPLPVQNIRGWCIPGI